MQYIKLIVDYDQVELIPGMKGGLIIFKNQSMLSHILPEPHDNKIVIKII